MPMELDLHIHSKFSFDSLCKISTILRIANRKGLRGIAITDHNTISGGIRAVKQNATSLVVIVGSEIATDIGDIIGLFLNEEIRSKEAFSVLDEIKEQGGISVMPHPFVGFARKLDTQKTLEILRRVDAIEGLNSRHPLIESELNYLKYLEKPLVAGSDAHFSCEIGLCRTILLKDYSNPEEIRKALQNDCISVNGVYGKKYLSSASQIMRRIKRKEFSSLFPLMLQLLRAMMYEGGFIAAARAVK